MFKSITDQRLEHIEATKGLLILIKQLLLNLTTSTARSTFTLITDLISSK